MMLTDKVAVVYGAGGAIGGAVARAFAREGARLYLTGPRAAPVESVARESSPAAGRRKRRRSTRSTSGRSTRHLRPWSPTAGRVDISFNAIGIADAEILGVPLVDAGRRAVHAARSRPTRRRTS